MAKIKLYAVIKHHHGRSHTIMGTVKDLVEYFGYTLECGHSWNYRINPNPTTFKGFLAAYTKSIHETQGSCYDPDWIEAAEVTPEMASKYEGTSYTF